MRLAALVLALGALASGSAQAAPGLLVGIDDDSVKWTALTRHVVATQQDLGLGAVKVTMPWHPGEWRPRGLDGTALHRIARAVFLGRRVVLSVPGPATAPPRSASARDQYCGFVSSLLSKVPAIEDVVIWNEANAPSSWRPQLGAAVGYERLLARCWDVLHAMRRHVNVISSTAPHHDPARFLRALGEAYRASGRTRPIVDTFGHNPYPDYSAEQPWTRHDDAETIGEGDYARLLSALDDGFSGTAQPLPGEKSVHVWYLEDGFQTTVPARKRRFYRGDETDESPVPALGGVGIDAPVDQATQLADALRLAYCQPGVGAFFNFELQDEWRLEGWQSGVLWADGTRKPSYQAFKDAIAAVAARDVDCAAIP